ncbi:MAG: class I SAM-dependent methyltransferase [Elusimicrobia bacterium]|nr:class I SAM-dependent methyltransferase [Elusimicrobiota bacterium]
MDKDEEKSCTVCGAPGRLTVARPEGSLYRCPACDHCFSGLETMPEHESYGDEYYDEKHRAWFENPNTELFDYIQGWVTRVGPRASVLDVGAGRGDFLRHLRAKEPGLALTGVDVSPIPPAEGITWIRGDALDLKLARRFDAVLSLAVIEHVVDIHGFVRGLKALCAPGGLVVVMTVNDRSILYGAARAMRWLGLSGPFNRLYEKHHVNHFNVSSLRRLLDSEGLSIIETHYHNIPMAAVDIEAPSAPIAAIYRVGVRGAFALGTILRKTYLQTIVCRNAGP